MQITHLRMSGFQSFGPDVTEIALRDVTYVLGPNGAGKTAVLEALSRLFSPLSAQRKVRHSDFHIPNGQTAAEVHVAGPVLWIEVDLEVPESGTPGHHASVPPNFAHMRIATEDGVPRIRVRLTATIAADNVIEEKLEYILEADADGELRQRADMSRFDRANIEVHYLPARRDPAEHIAYTTASLVGRALRAADWTAERTTLDTLSKSLTDALADNDAVKSIGVQLAGEWKGVHSGAFFTDPSIAFGSGDLVSVLRQLTVSFAPSRLAPRFRSIDSATGRNRCSTSPWSSPGNLSRGKCWVARRPRSISTACALQCTRSSRSRSRRTAWLRSTSAASFDSFARLRSMATRSLSSRHTRLPYSAESILSRSASCASMATASLRCDGSCCRRRRRTTPRST